MTWLVGEPKMSNTLHCRLFTRDGVFRSWAKHSSDSIGIWHTDDSVREIHDRMWIKVTQINEEQASSHFAGMTEWRRSREMSGNICHRSECAIFLGKPVLHRCSDASSISRWEVRRKHRTPILSLKTMTKLFSVLIRDESFDNQSSCRN